MKKILIIFGVILLAFIIVYMVMQNQTDKKEIVNKNKESNTPAIQDNIKTSRLYIVRCSACHGRDGKGGVGLNIIGKNKDEILEALRKYKHNDIKTPLMANLINQMPENELELIAEEMSLLGK